MMSGAWRRRKTLRGDNAKRTKMEEQRDRKRVEPCVEDRKRRMEKRRADGMKGAEQTAQKCERKRKKRVTKHGEQKVRGCAVNAERERSRQFSTVCRRLMYCSSNNAE